MDLSPEEKLAVLNDWLEALRSLIGLSRRQLDLLTDGDDAGRLDGVLAEKERLYLRSLALSERVRDWPEPSPFLLRVGLASETGVEAMRLKVKEALEELSRYEERSKEAARERLRSLKEEEEGLRREKSLVNAYAPSSPAQPPRFLDQRR